MHFGVEIRRAGDRFRTKEDGVDAWHCFSYADHYDPANTHFGVLVAHNEFTLQPGCGFHPHRHSENEIVTWVLDGELCHTDDGGHRSTLHAGQAQRMTAGRGIVHGEMNDHPDEPARFVQMWIRPDQPGLVPSYDRHDFTSDLTAGHLVAVASGRTDRPAPLRISQRAATLYVARPQPGQVIDLPAAPYRHVYVAAGQLTLADEHLSDGDEARITGESAHSIVASHAGEIVVWEMHATA
jgi:redox-sensitive bicupin YhaK (pirin superfamily)